MFTSGSPQRVIATYIVANGDQIKVINIVIALFLSSQLLTIYPEDNSLALVYRDKETLKFVKHVNHKSSSDSAGTSTCRTFYDFSFVYYE